MRRGARRRLTGSVVLPVETPAVDAQARCCRGHTRGGRRRPAPLHPGFEMFGSGIYTKARARICGNLFAATRSARSFCVSSARAAAVPGQQPEPRHLRHGRQLQRARLLDDWSIHGRLHRVWLLLGCAHRAPPLCNTTPLDHRVCFSPTQGTRSARRWSKPPRPWAFSQGSSSPSRVPTAVSWASANKLRRRS